MDSKFYISYKAARLLKEKGYSEEVELFYNTLGELNNVSDMFCCEIADNTQMEKYDYLSAPTKAEAIDWLESKGIVIAISLTYNRKWFCTIESLERGEIVSTLDLPTRLEAEDAAIIKALELLKGKEE